MTVYRSAHGAIKFLACGLAAALIIVSPVRLAQAASMPELVGSWYSETTEDKTKMVAGKPYTLRRELLVNRPDGTKSNIQRYYDGSQLVAEIITTYKWGVQGSLYWTVCQMDIYNGAATPCSERYEYDLISVTPDQIQYKSRKSGITYTSRRVPDNFRLP